MKNRKPPLRMCVGCREMKDKRELTRVVRTADGTVEIDPTGRKNGRGAYICSAQCLMKARKKNLLGRALNHPVDDAVYDTLLEQLTDGSGVE
jgi:predicted RNA-binding protein YlxR (DUF448 family)